MYSVHEQIIKKYKQPDNVINIQTKCTIMLPCSNRKICCINVSLAITFEMHEPHKENIRDIIFHKFHIKKNILYIIFKHNFQFQVIFNMMEKGLSMNHSPKINEK